ncbi:MAG: hypothetical protein JWP29_1214 [Rhodoferax sp.]|nr:hypothetical protein [Rhodoferax sp.]
MNGEGRIKKTPNPPGRCIFCGEGQLTKEHIYAAWMKPYLTESKRTVHHVTTSVHPALQHLADHRNEVGKMHLKGDHRSRALRAVCRSCNNGWMSVLQSSAKSVLLPFIQGTYHSPTREEQKAAAAWVTMFAMVFEQADLFTRAIDQKQRDFFMRHLKPPSNWLIWVAPFVGSKHSASTRHRGILFSGETPVETIPPGFMNMQCTVGVAGNMFFMSLSSTHADVINFGLPAVRQLCMDRGFLRAWPTVGFQQNASGAVDDFLFVNIIDEVTETIYRSFNSIWR